MRCLLVNVHARFLFKIMVLAATPFGRAQLATMFQYRPERPSTRREFNACRPVVNGVGSQDLTSEHDALGSNPAHGQVGQSSQKKKSKSWRRRAAGKSLITPPRNEGILSLFFMAWLVM